MESKGATAAGVRLSLVPPIDAPARHGGVTACRTAGPRMIIEDQLSCASLDEMDVAACFAAGLAAPAHRSGSGVVGGSTTRAMIDQRLAGFRPRGGVEGASTLLAAQSVDAIARELIALAMGAMSANHVPQTNLHIRARRVEPHPCPQGVALHLLSRCRCVGEGGARVLRPFACHHHES